MVGKEPFSKMIATCGVVFFILLNVFNPKLFNYRFRQLKCNINVNSSKITIQGHALTL